MGSQSISTVAFAFLKDARNIILMAATEQIMASILDLKSEHQRYHEIAEDQGTSHGM